MVWYALTQHQNRSGLVCDRASRPLRNWHPDTHPDPLLPNLNRPVRRAYSYLAGIPSHLLRGCICNGGEGPEHNLGHPCGRHVCATAPKESTKPEGIQVEGEEEPAAKEPETGGEGETIGGSVEEVNEAEKGEEAPKQENVEGEEELEEEEVEEEEKEAEVKEEEPKQEEVVETSADVQATKPAEEVEAEATGDAEITVQSYSVVPPTDEQRQPVEENGEEEKKAEEEVEIAQEEARQNDEEQPQAQGDAEIAVQSFDVAAPIEQQQPLEKEGTTEEQPAAQNVVDEEQQQYSETGAEIAVQSFETAGKEKQPEEETGPIEVQSADEAEIVVQSFDAVAEEPPKKEEQKAEEEPVDEPKSQSQGDEIAVQSFMVAEQKEPVAVDAGGDNEEDVEYVEEEVEEIEEIVEIIPE